MLSACDLMRITIKDQILAKYYLPDSALREIEEPDCWLYTSTFTCMDHSEVTLSITINKVLGSLTILQPGNSNRPHREVITGISIEWEQVYPDEMEGYRKAGRAAWVAALLNNLPTFTRGPVMDLRPPAESKPTP